MKDYQADLEKLRKERPNARSSGTWLPTKRSAKCSIAWHVIWIN